MHICDCSTLVSTLAVSVFAACGLRPFPLHQFWWPFLTHLFMSLAHVQPTVTAVKAGCQERKISLTNVHPDKV